MKKLFSVLGVLLISAMLLCACGEADGEKQTLSCILSIKCDTILQNMDKLSAEKKEIIPQDGVVMLDENVSFSQGDNLLDILRQALKERKIHIDFEESTSTGSAYVRGIANIYSGDCGDLSGWMIRANGEDLTVGCSDYFPENGDTIEWLYTCNMGEDL